MNIIFERVILENFLSFKHADVSLNNNGYVVVSGLNRYSLDGAKSNGAGKSTLWDAITWCLTGETIRGVKDIVNNLFKDAGCYVELFFEIDGKKYHLIRSKDHQEYKTNLKIFIDGKDKSGKGIRDSEKLLQEYIPDLTSSFIGSVIILGQGLPERFTNNTPAGRKDILEKLSKSDFMINDIKQAVTTRQIALQRELRAVQDDSLTHTSKQQLLVEQHAILRNKLATLGSTDEFKEELRKAETDLELVIEELKEVSSERYMLNSSIQAVRKQYTEYLQEVQQSIDVLAANHNENINIAVKQQAELTSKYNSLISEINKLKNITDTCPTCGQKLPGVDKPDTTVQEHECEQVKEALDKTNLIHKSLLEAYQQARQELDVVVAEKKSVFIKRGEELDLQLRNIDTTYVTLTGNKTELDNRIFALESKIDNFNENLKKLNESIDTNDKLLVDLSDKILYNKTQEEDLALHLEVLNKMNTIVTRDFRGFLLSNIISFIDSCAKSYSMDIFGTDKVAVYLEGNNIEICYNEKSYSALSGGERQKVDIIVQLSIRDMLSTFMGYSCNILVLDEIFDNLDTKGCDQLLNLFVRKLSDLSSIYIISHHADSLNIPYDKELVVVKNEDGYSEIQ